MASVHKKNGLQAVGKSRGGLTAKIHMIAAGPGLAEDLLLMPGNIHDAAIGRELLKAKNVQSGIVIVDRAD